MPLFKYFKELNNIVMYYDQNFLVVAVQSLSCVQLFSTPWTTAHEASLFFTISWNWLRLMSIESVMPSSLFSFCLQAFPASGSYPSEPALCIRWPKQWSFSFSISLSNEYARLISFRIDWFDILSVQGTLKNLLQHHNSKASILWCSALWHSAFFMVQFSHPYMTTGETIVLTTRTFVGKVIYLCFLIHCLGLSQLFFQRVRIFCFLGI